MKAMKHTFRFLAAAAIAAAVLPACSSEEPLMSEGEGTVFLSATLNSDVKVRSRADLDELRQSCMIWISNSQGVVRQFATSADIPENGVKLISGHYVAEAWAGDSVPASWTDRYFKGSEDFDISRGSTSAVEITCKIANTVVAVEYDDNIADILSDLSMTVGHSQGSLTFEGETASQKGYFMMNSRDHGLTYTLTGNLHNGTQFTRTGTIDDCRPATQYTLRVHCNETVEEIGGAFLTIEVDESEVVVEDEIQIVAAPSIEGYKFDISQPVRAEMGTVGRKSVFMKSSAEMTSVLLSAAVFEQKLGLGGSEFDLFRMASDYLPVVEAAGINYEYHYDATTDMAWLKLNFEEEFTNTLANGEYPIDITVTDANGKKASATLLIVVSDAPVATGGCEPTSVWATSAVITGTVAKAEASQPHMVYRARGTQGWTSAATTVSGTTLTAALTGLQPGTTYEYAAATADYIGADIKTFTTETASQLPNSGFEDWCTSGKEAVPAASATNRFWGTGNVGSNMGNKNITTSDTEYKHSGNYSLKMTSTSIVGTMAAGNVFVGDFLRVDGTNGVLGWGRPWASRPTKLRGYVKYSPVAVTNEKSDYSYLKKGQMDHGIIYIALLDGSQLQSDNGSSYPFIIKTKASDRQLFDPESANIIAYGKLEFSEATAGDGLVAFEIPIVYRRQDVKPSYIMMTASSSIGGDYFVGGAGSTMWLDDLELVY